MAQCKTCGEYYRLSPYNQTEECNNCIDQLGTPDLDSEDQIEVDHLLNPTRRTPAHFLDE